MLGIVFGVCSVIAMLAIGEGASFEAQEQIKNLGSQNIILRSVKPPEEQRFPTASQSYVLQYGLTYTDMAHSAPFPDRCGRAGRRAGLRLAHQPAGGLRALGTPWFEMRNHRPAGAFSRTDGPRHMCVLGAEMAGAFSLTPDCQDVRVGAVLPVIGVMEPRGKSPKPPNPRKAPPPDVHPAGNRPSRYGKSERERSGSFEAEQVELHEVTVKIDARASDVGGRCDQEVMTGTIKEGLRGCRSNY
jgi:putative ABC transport system permease protein